ncbi:MAG: outer membrane protein transport protein [Sulfurovum sp.]|nr:outer membrane protein transport protein [Sulfurovum sp.]
MMERLAKGFALSVVTSAMVMAGGYKIPQQSLNSMALSAAYIAETKGADTAYYNPANMVFMDEKQYVEGAATLIRAPKITYSLGAASGESEAETSVIPAFHYVSAPIRDFRWGVSLTVPGGSTKQWKTPYQKAFAEEFTLKIIELNPSVAYKIMDNLSIAAGARFIYSEGVVKNDASGLGSPLKVNMEGDTVEFGYNLALTYKPTSDINLAATYRSNIDLQEEGTATITYPVGSPTGTTITGDAGVSIPLPATLNVAVSKTWNNTFTLEAVYEKTYWSTYKKLEFTNTNLPITTKNWKDTNTFRFGATIVMENKLTMMLGFALDETPVPLETLGFELPDGDAKIFSMGFRYQQTQNLSWGAALLHTAKEGVSLSPGVNTVNPILAKGGSFGGGGAFLTTIGVAYEF